MNHRHHTLRRLLTGIAAATCLVAGGTAIAQSSSSYPTKPITLVVPFAPGGTTDLLARAVGFELTKAMGQQVIIDNRPGAGGNIGAQLVSRAAPDGYTLLMGTVGTHGINHALYPKLPYDPIKDFAPVTEVASVPNILVLNAGLAENNKITDVKSFVNYAKANPGKLSMASAGNGTSIHLSGELFKMYSKTYMVHVPYRGSSPAIADLIAGQVDLMFDNLPSAMPHIKSGKLRALAVTSNKRSPSLPQVPTIAETGGSLAGYDATSWFGILAPAGTPKEIVNKLQQEISKALASPAMKEKMLSQGAEPVGSTPEQFAAYIQSESAKWAKVVKESGAKVD